MKVAILAGGAGTRISEETANKPKPMVEVGGKPILWHIMKSYASYGYNEFVIALGYKGEYIKDYFVNYATRMSSMSVKLRSGEIQVHNSDAEDWTVHLLDTGANTNTGGRVKRVINFVGNEPLLMTYGDSVGDVDITKLVAFHKKQRTLATVTAVHPPARFGAISLDGTIVNKFAEKPRVVEGRINGGFFVLEPSVATYISNDETLWEGSPMEQLSKEKQLSAYTHDSFWQCMDTLRDLKTLETLWQSQKPPWKNW